MKIASSFQNIFSKAKRAIGEAVVGDDFFRQDGLVDGVMLGATGGAAVGGAVGALRGAYHQASNNVTERMVTEQIKDPSLDGYNYSVREDWDEEAFCDDDEMFCDEELDGWYHRYSPRIENRIVGTYEVPRLENSHTATIVGSALAGAAIGAGVGGALGMATGVIGHFMGGHPLKREKRLPGHVREKLIEETGTNVVKSTAIGAGVGAALGLGAGLLEQSSAMSAERTWIAPVLTDKNLGQIPRDHYEWNNGWDLADPTDYSNHSPRGNENVIRPVPVYDGAGRPQMQEVTKTLDSSRLTPMSGMLGGAAVGAGVGFAAGVSSSILNRVLMQNALQ